MQTSITRTALAVAAALLLLASCGGGELAGPDAVAAGARDFAVRAQSAATAGIPARKLVLSIRANAPNDMPQMFTTVGAKELFDWAEYIYPTLFPKGPQNFPFTHLGTNYTIRSYPNGNYLGLTDGGLVYGLGPFTANVLTPFGKLSDYVAQVQADECKVHPGNCDTPPPTGPINECTMPASTALAIGNRTILSYESTGAGETSTVNSDSLVDQNTTFEGQSVVRISSTLSVSSNVGGQTITFTSKDKSYEQVATGGMTRAIGHESESSTGGILFMGQLIGGVTTNSRTIYNPGALNSEFTLTVGQSLTKRTTSTTTTTSSTNPTPVVSTGTQIETHTYERRESVTVRGKTYDTCRYRDSDGAGSVTTQWIIVGKGVGARMETVSGGTTSVTELVSGTLNGVPL